MLMVRATVVVFWAAAAPQADFPAKFEVASIKPAAPNDRMGNFPTPGTLSIGNRTLREIMIEAYHVRPYQVLGGPAWMDTDHFNIVGKAAARSNMTDMMKMVIPLLEDRFQLKTHRETREVKQYALVMAKSGPKMKAAGETAGCCSFGKGLIKANRMDMTYLADYLARVLGCPVLNETGITGNYQFVLRFNEDYAMPQDASEAAATPDPANAPIYTAIQEQLGLKLETRRGPVEVIVVESAVKPSAN